MNLGFSIHMISNLRRAEVAYVQYVKHASVNIYCFWIIFEPPFPFHFHFHFLYSESDLSEPEVAFLLSSGRIGGRFRVETLAVPQIAGFGFSLVSGHHDRFIFLATVFGLVYFHLSHTTEKIRDRRIWLHDLFLTVKSRQVNLYLCRVALSALGRYIQMSCVN